MSVEKIKAFTTTNNPQNLEEEINKWLAKNNDVVIVSRQVTSTTGTGIGGLPFISFTIFIFYRER